MKDEIIKYETAILAKEKGFDIPTKLCCSDSDKYALPFNGGNDCHVNSKHPYYSAPTQSLLQRWLRDNYQYYVHPYPNHKNKWQFQLMWNAGDMYRVIFNSRKFYDTYESALEAGLFEALKLIKNA